MVSIISKESWLKLFKIFKPTCELGYNHPCIKGGYNAFVNELHKSFSKGVCVENHAFHTKPVW